MMAAIRYPVEVGDPEGGRYEARDALVDTNAPYTSVPRDVLARLGVEAEKEANFILANGQSVKLGMGWISIRLDGREQPTLAIFGEPDSTVLLGAFTLEGFRLGVDAVNERLISTSGYLVGIRLQGTL
jgi:predicted aspartyl protease